MPSPQGSGFKYAEGEIITFKTGDKVLHFGVIEEQLEAEQTAAADMKWWAFFLSCRLIDAHLSLMVDVVEVFSDARLGTLALDVVRGCSGAAAAGEQAPAAQSRKPERQHGPPGAPDGGYAP